MFLTKFCCELRRKIIKSYIHPIAYHLANSFGNEVISKQKRKSSSPKPKQTVERMWYCDRPKNNLQPYFTSIHGCRPGARVVGWGGGRHRKFWWGKKIYLGMKTKKIFIANASQWRRSCYFLLEHNFCFGAQKPSLMRILPSHSGEDQKKNKSLLWKCTSVALVLLLSFGARFSLGGHILACGHKNLLWYGFCPHIREWRPKTKQKGLYHKCTPTVSVLLLSFGEHILACGHKNLLWYGFCHHIRGWRLKTKQKGLYHKCTPMVSVLLLSLGAQFSLAWVSTFLAWGSRPRNDPRGAGPAWMFL